jgi:hypothetical protein
MIRRQYRPGEAVIFRMGKHSTSPGPRAVHVHPASRGEFYSYEVDKFWVVQDVRPDGMLVVRTRRGKQHVISADDPRLRPPTWWERLTCRHRFPDLQAASV